MLNSDLAHMQSFLYIRVRFSLYTCRVFYVNFVFSILGYHHRLTDDGGIQNNIYFEVSMCSRYRWYRTYSCLEKNNSWYGGCLAHLHFASTLFSNLYYSFIYESDTILQNSVLRHTSCIIPDSNCLCVLDIVPFE